MVKRSPRSEEEAGGLLKCLGIDIDEDGVENVEVSTITVDIDVRKKRGRC
jgi:hypothetical protein